jgi:hypothetical protein
MNPIPLRNDISYTLNSAGLDDLFHMLPMALANND